MHAKIHPVFHPMYLKPTQQTTVERGLRKNLESTLDPGHYEVEHILAHHKGRKGTEYLVQWANCSYLQSTWEPESGLASAQAALAAYAQKVRKIAVHLDEQEG